MELNVMVNRRLAGMLLTSLLALGTAAPTSAAPARTAATARPSAKPAIPVYTYQVVRTYPHDPNAFTQGLVYRDGFLYESTGLPGRSSVRKVNLETGEVIDKVDLPDEMFGEGLTDWQERLIGITWQSQVGFVLDLAGLSLQRQFRYAGEGWGLTHDERELIMSDGTSSLRFIDPETLQETRRLKVTADGTPVDQLNELEWVDGELFANVWQTDRIARIDAKTGRVTGWIDLQGLLPARDRIVGHTDVLNGIAYDPPTKRLFVTGKFWPAVFEIRLVSKPAAPTPRR